MHILSLLSPTARMGVKETEENKVAIGKRVQELISTVTSAPPSQGVIMIAAGYTIDLYCDCAECAEHQGGIKTHLGYAQITGETWV